jgi:formylmethanofuran dehydrogenase subunit C
MTACALRLKTRPPQAVDMAPLLPETLQGKSIEAVRAIPLACGGRRMSVGDLFEVSESDADGLRIAGSTDRLTGIGTGMTQGRIEVRGNAGDYLGRNMKGGTIRVRGNAGHYAGNGMSGGVLDITGDAGDYLGGARQGDPYGLAGGTILVAGQMGDRAGDRMRRGIIAISGDAGDYCGARMLAGTILVLGHTGSSPGLGMRRGSLILAHPPKDISATFASSGVLTLDFLEVLFRHLAGTYRQLSGLRGRGANAERYCGDLSAGGKGELLLLSDED